MRDLEGKEEGRKKERKWNEENKDLNSYTWELILDFPTPAVQKLSSIISNTYYIFHHT